MHYLTRTHRWGAAKWRLWWISLWTFHCWRRRIGTAIRRLRLTPLWTFHCWCWRIGTTIRWLRWAPFRSFHCWIWRIGAAIRRLRCMPWCTVKVSRFSYAMKIRRTLTDLFICWVNSNVVHLYITYCAFLYSLFIFV